MSKKLALLAPIAETDVWNIGISFKNHFVKKGVEVRHYNTIINDEYTDQDLRRLIQESNDGTFVPDIVFHLDFGLFGSPLLKKSSIPTAKWVAESGDDPQNYRLNYPKMKEGNFDLVLSPDIRTATAYKDDGIKAAWCPYFADPDQFDGVEQEPIYDAVTTRHFSEPFFRDLKKALGDRFVPRSGDMFQGKEHARHLKKGHIVVQNSKYKEVTRRVFEAMMANRLVLADRPDPGARMDLLFTEGEHIVYFDSLDDCINKINYYMTHRDERLAISERGFKKVSTTHTTPNRVEKILELIQ